MRHLIEVLKEAANGNEEAYRFLHAYFNYCHAIDDIIDRDKDKHGPQDIHNTFIMALEIYSSNYYLRHYDALYLLCQILANAHADSLEFEKSDELWKKETANILRSQTIDMVMAVACLEGGWPLMRKLSAEVRELCNHDQGKDKIVCLENEGSVEDSQQVAHT